MTARALCVSAPHGDADDLAEVQRRIETAGGRIVKPAYSFPGGRRFHFSDPDGYQLAVWSAR